jgi:hypothetical protein
LCAAANREQQQRPRHELREFRENNNYKTGKRKRKNKLRENIKEMAHLSLLFSRPSRFLLSLVNLSLLFRVIRGKSVFYWQ